MAESTSFLSSMGLAGLLAVLGLLALGLWYTSPVWRLALVIGCRRFSAKWVWGIGLVVSLAAAGVSIHHLRPDIPGYPPNGSIAETAYRTLSLLAFSADWTMAPAQAPPEGEGPRELPLAIDIFRFWIPAWVVGLGGSLLLFRQLGHGLQRRLMPRRGHTVVLGLGEAGLAYVTCWSDKAAPGPAPRPPAAEGEPARRRWRRWRRWLTCEPPPEPWWPNGLRGGANRWLGRFLCRLPLCHRLGPFLCHGPIVVVERDPDNPAVRSCRRLGIPVLIGDALDTAGDVLRYAGVQHAATVVGLLPDDVANVELALRVQQFRADHAKPSADRAPANARAQADARAPLILISQVNDLHLVRRLNHYEKITKMSPTDVRFQNIYRLMADQLLLRHPPDFYAELFEAPAPHIVIYGFGQLGQQVFAETLRLGHALDQGVPRVTIVDRDGARVRQVVQAEYPGIFDSGTPDVIVLRIAEVTLPGPVVPDDLPARLDDPLPTQHVVCFDDECFALSFALALRDALLGGVRRNAPIFVRTRRKHGLAALLDSNTGRREIPDGIFPFGTLERILRPEILNDRGLEALSEAIHEVTYKLAGEVGKDQAAPPDAADDRAAARAAAAGRAAATAWESLDDLFRRSNRLAALHLDSKLRGLDLRRVPVTDAEISVPEVWTRRLEDLARLEHRRWLGAQVADGWRYGLRMDTLRRHTAMEDFDRLGPRDQDNDYLATALLPGIVGANAAHCKDAIWRVRHREDEKRQRMPGNPYPALTRPLNDKLAKVRRHPQRLCPVARVGILAPPPCAADAGPDRHGAIEAQLLRFRAHFEANDRQRLKALAREQAVTIVSPLLHSFERAAASWLYHELAREAPAPAPTPIALSNPARHEILALLPVPYDFLSGVEAVWGPIGDDGERAPERAFQELAGQPHVRHVEMPLSVPGHALSAREGLHGRRYLAQFRETWRYTQRRCTELHLLSIAPAASPGDASAVSPNPAEHLHPVNPGDGARPALQVYTTAT